MNKSAVLLIIQGKKGKSKSISGQKVKYLNKEYEILYKEYEKKILKILKIFT